MVEMIQELLAVDWGTFFGALALIIAGVPAVKKALADFEKDSGFVFPWTTRKRETQQKFKELDDKFESRYTELNQKIESIHTKELEQQKEWHQQSINIRDRLSDNQKRLEENQERFIETLGNISTALEEIKTDIIDERLERKRWNILNCASQLRNGNLVDPEQFNNVFRDYDFYERLIHENNLTNGLVEESIKFIRIKYHELLNEDN